MTASLSSSLALNPLKWLRPCPLELPKVVQAFAGIILVDWTSDGTPWRSVVPWVVLAASRDTSWGSLFPKKEEGGSIGVRGHEIQVYKSNQQGQLIGNDSCKLCVLYV